MDNLLAMENLAGRPVLPSQLDEITRLFALCNCPLDLGRASATLASEATSTERFQICVGRALLQRPVHLDVGPANWSADLTLTPWQFAQAYEVYFPWRSLTLPQDSLALPALSGTDHAHG